MLLIPLLFAGIRAYDDYFLNDGFYPILSDFYKGKLYMVKMINNFADEIGSVCVGDEKYSLKNERNGKRFADAVCNRLGFAGAKFHGQKNEYSGKISNLNPSRTCDFDFVVNGAKCNGTSLEQCHMKEVAHSGKGACITGESELFLECDWDGNYNDDKLTKIETNECADGDEFETILRMCGVPKAVEAKRGSFAATSSRVKRCYGPLIERKCCKNQLTVDYNADYYSTTDDSNYGGDYYNYGGSDPFASERG